MNIRPIDLQVMLPRTTDISRVQSINDQHQTLQNTQLVEQWQQISHDRLHNVQHVPKDEAGKVGAHREHTNNGQHQHQQQNNSANAHSTGNDQVASEDPFRGHRVDIIT